MGRTKNTIPSVKLRFKELKTGKVSLSLRFHPQIFDEVTGKYKESESLNIFITPKTDKNNKPIKDKNGKYQLSTEDQNKLRTAEIIRNQREEALLKGSILSIDEAEKIKQRQKSEGDFINYFNLLIRQKKGSNRSNWEASLKHICIYLKTSLSKESIRFCDITLEFCEGFRSYLLRASSPTKKQTLKINTASSYFDNFRSAIKSAFKHDYLVRNLNDDLKSIKEEDSIREVLTEDELVILSNTNCTDEILKKAALFSSLTSLRHSDIRHLKWENIIETYSGYSLRYKEQKTNKLMEIPISEEALSYCGARKDKAELVFEGMKKSQYSGDTLTKWLKDAKIDKKITFHCFRHTFATLQLAKGANIVVIQRVMGHKDIKTTMRYLKIDEAMIREVMNRITLKRED